MQQKALIFGSKGMLAYDMSRVFTSEFRLAAVDKEEVDITDSVAVEKCIQEENPAVVINCAAFTVVDECETQRDLAMQVNGFAVKNIAMAAKKIGAKVIYFSTDYVFDGTKELGYKETDKKHPINTYGSSKALGEDLLLHAYPDGSYIVRTAWLYGKNGKNFVTTMLELAQKHDSVQVVNDQIGSPTYTKDLAQAVYTLIKYYPPSTYHLVNNGAVSWYDFAREIFQIKNVKVRVEPVSTEQFPRPALRPKYSILLNTKLPHLRDWKEALSDFFINDI